LFTTLQNIYSIKLAFICSMRELIMQKLLTQCCKLVFHTHGTPTCMHFLQSVEAYQISANK